MPSTWGRIINNPECTQVGDKHKHRWSERFRDKEAYAPDDITAPVTDPIAVWEELALKPVSNTRGQ